MNYALRKLRLKVVDKGEEVYREAGSIMHYDRQLVIEGFSSCCAELKDDPKLLVDVSPEAKELVESVKDIREYLECSSMSAFKSRELVKAMDRVVESIKPWEKT